MNPNPINLKLPIVLCVLSVCFAAKRRGIRASVYLLAFFTALNLSAQTALTVSGSAYTETDATHTTGNVNTVGSYTGTNIRFTGAVTVSGSSAFTVDTGTFAAITGSGAATLALTSATASGAVNVLDRSTLTLVGGTFNSTLTVNGTSSAALTEARVVGATNLYNGSTLTVSAGTLAAVTGSNAAALSLRNSVAGNTTLRETGLADFNGSTVTGYVYHYNTAAVTGTLLMNSSTITGVYTGSNTRVAQITDSKIGGATIINNLSGESGTLTVNNSALAAVSGSGLDTVAITGGTTGALTFRETRAFTLATATSGNLAFYNTTVSGSFAVQNSSVGATGAGTVTGSNLAAFSLHNSAAGDTMLRETGLVNLDGSTVTGYVRHYNTAVTGTLLMTGGTITSTYTGSNTRVAQIIDSKIGGATVINNLSGESGTLTVNNSTLAAVTGSNFAVASLQDSAAGNTTLRETGLVNLDGSTVTGYVYHYNTAAVTGTLLLTDGTITGAYTGSNTRVAQITDSRIGGATVINNLSGESGTLTVNNSALAAVTGSGLDTVTITGGTTGALTFRETRAFTLATATSGNLAFYNTTVSGSFAVQNSSVGATGTGAITGSNAAVVSLHNSAAGNATLYETGLADLDGATVTGYVRHYNTAVTGTLLMTGGTITSAYTGSNTRVAQIIDSKIGGATVINNLSGESGTLTVNSSTLAAVTGSNFAVASLQDSAAGNTTLRETGLADFNGSTVTGYVYHYNTAAVTGTLLLTDGTITGAYTGSNTRVAQITDSKIGGAIVINNLSGASGTLTVNRSTLAAVTATHYDTVSVRDSVTGRITTGTNTVVIASSTIAGATFADVTGTLTDLHVTAGISLTGSSDVFMGDATSRVNGSTVSVGGTAVFTGSNLQLQNTSTAVNASSAAAISVGGSGRVYVTDSVLETQVGASDSSGRYIGVIFGNGEASYISVENSRLSAHAEGRGISFQGSDGVVRDTVITTEDGIGVFQSGAANVWFENADILVTGTDAYGMYARGSGTLTVLSSTITTLREDAIGVCISGVDADTVTGILSETVIDTGGAYAYGLWGVSGVTIIASGGTIRTAGSYAYGVYLSATAAGTFTDVDIRTSGSYAYGVCLYTAATGTLIGLDINTLGNNAYGVYLSATAAGTLTDLTVNTSGTAASGIFVNTAAAVTVSGGTFATTGVLAHGLRTRNPQAVALTGAAITTSGSAATGVLYNSGAAGVGGVTLTEVAVSTTGADAAALTLVGEEDGFHQTLTVTGGAFTSAQGAALRVGHPDLFGYGAADDFNGAYDLTLDGVVLTGATDAVNLTSLYYRNYTPDDAVDAPVAVTLSATNTVFNGGLTATGTGLTATLTLERSTLTGDITAQQARVTLRLRDHSTLTGAIDPVDLELSGGSNWNLTGPSSLHTLTGASGTITIAGVRGADLTVSDGIGGRTALNLTLSDSAQGRQEIQVVVDETGAMSGDAFSLANTLSTGMQTYGLDNRLDGAWLVLGGGAGGGFTGGGDAVLNSAAAVSGFWFTQQDNLHQRMGELRYGARASRPQLPGGRDPRAPNDWLDNIWVRSYGQQANINTGISGLKGFSETQYGVDLGTDHAWLIDDHHTLYTGVFAGYGGADRDFHSGYHGSTDSGYGGLYGTWLHKDGWYADALAKGQYFDTSFDGDDHGSYHSYGVGLSLELGRQFQFADGWFAEPSVQVSYLHLLNDGYATDSGMAVGLADSDIVQFYGGARLGRNIKLNQDGWLQPYVKVGGVEQLSSGGQVRAGGGEWRPATDGARGVLGAGIVYQLTAADQLHLDYEASFGDKYDKPWGLTAGYRHQF